MCLCGACPQMPFPRREFHAGSGSAFIQTVVLNGMSPAKDTNLTKFPRALVLHLKRFVWEPQRISVSSQVFIGSRPVGRLSLARKEASI